MVTAVVVMMVTAAVTVRSLTSRGGGDSRSDDKL